jgi:hypothetical protein
MTLALQKLLDPAAGESESRLNLDVVFTSVEPTLAALKTAGALARRLNARITLVVPQIVPYPLLLKTPPVLIEFNERRFRIIASQCPVAVTVRIYLCRDTAETLAGVLKPDSVVVLGGRRRWWPTAEKRLARKLRRVGHKVIFTETE